MKTGKTAAGNRAVSSHTASLAGDYASFAAAVAQHNIIEAANENELVSFCEVLSSYTKPIDGNIGIITGPMSWWEAQERLAGWREMVGEGDNPEKLVYEGDWTVESGDCGFAALYGANPDLDAIFVSNDQMSLGVIQAANRNGLKIPDDLGLVGFDNVAESKFYSPPLTTVHQPARHLGGLAVARLDQCIHHEYSEDCIEKGENVVVPDLIVRRSSVRSENQVPDADSKN